MPITQQPQFFFNLLLAACISIASIAHAAPQEVTHSMASMSGAASGGDFSLNSATGPVNLKQFRGKVIVLYFGYTSCPDACPTTLSALGAAMRSLTPADAAKVQPIFITLDPARDNAEHMRDYSRFFYPSLLGLTGSDERVAAVAKQYGVLYAKQKVDSSANYVVDHSSLLYVIGADGKLVSSVPYGSSPQAIKTALRAALPR